MISRAYHYSNKIQEMEKYLQDRTLRSQDLIKTVPAMTTTAMSDTQM